MRTLVIGRSPSADVVIADASLAPHHAELVVTDDGRFYVTDCGTDAGTWVRGEAAAGWQPVRQGFVRPDQPLRLGDHECTVDDLLRRHRGAAGGRLSRWRGRWCSVECAGPVARDPATGEIVRTSGLRMLRVADLPDFRARDVYGEPAVTRWFRPPASPARLPIVREATSATDRERAIGS